MQVTKEITGGAVTGVTKNAITHIKIPLPPLANHITKIRNRAKELQQQAKAGLAQARKEVEAMILGENASVQ